MKRKALASTAQPKPKRRKTIGRSLAQTQGFASTTKSSPEQKNFDSNVAAPIVVTQTTAVRSSIFSPDQGVGPSEHVGRAVECTSLSWKWSSSYAPTTAGSSPMRLLVVYDRQPNAALPAVTDVVNQDYINCHMNLANSKRFLVLVNEEFEGMSIQGPNAFFKTGYVSFKRRFNGTLRTEFNDVNGGTIADITTGSFIALTWQNGNIITAAPTDTLDFRIRYIDA